MTISTLFTLTLALFRGARESRIKIFLLMIYDHICAIFPHPDLFHRRGKTEDRWTTCGKIGGGNAQKAGSYKLTWIIPEKLSMKLKKSVEIFVDKL